MPNTNYAKAASIISRLQDSLDTIAITYNDALIHVSASFGLYQMHDEEILEKVIIEADKKLYEIKENLKNNQANRS